MKLKNKARKLLPLMLLLAVLTLSGCAGKTSGKTVLKLDSAGETSDSEKPEKLSEDWYGWWVMTDASGDWKSMDGQWWDCCAEFRETKDGDYTLLIWDEDLPKDNYLAKLNFQRSDDDFGCVGGKLMDRTLSKRGCSLKLTDSEDGTLMTLTGKYRSDTCGTFSYTMRLRAWGEQWEEAKDELPYFYESWYLPLIEDDKPMPDKLPTEDELKKD